MLKYRKINENPNNTQIAYHATNSDFNEFDNSFIKRFDYGKGFYFTVNKAYAENYGEYLLTCEIPEDKYFLDLDIAWDNDNNYIQEALVELWVSIKNVEDKLKLEKVMFRDCCNTGWWIYNALTEIYDTTEQVQDLLYKYGIKGLYSFDGDCYIVFKKEDIKILNRQIIKESYKNEFAMKPYKDGNFNDFYNYCFNNRNTSDLSRYYYSFYNNKLGIPASKIIHTFEEHNTSLNDWLNLINNPNNCLLIVKSKFKMDFDNDIYLSLYKINNEYYGCIFAKCKKRWYVCTWFKDDKNKIIAWLKNKGETQPEVPTATNVPGFPLNEGSSNYIINQNLNNLNPYNKKSLQNEKLEKAEIQYGYSTIDTVISFDPSNYELQGLLNKHKALRILVAQEPGSGKLQLICMPATSGDHGLLATWLMEQGYKIFRNSFYHIVNSEKEPFLTLDSFYKDSEDLKYELLDELNSIYDNQELINKMLDEYDMLKELLPSIVNTEAMDYAVGEFL